MNDNKNTDNTIAGSVHDLVNWLLAQKVTFVGSRTLLLCWLNKELNQLVLFLIKMYCLLLLIVECQAVIYDYDLETNTCLKLLESTSGVTWREARVICEEDGGDLISILMGIRD